MRRQLQRWQQRPACQSEAKWNITTDFWWFISFYYFYWLWWWFDSWACQIGSRGFHKCNLVWLGLEINRFNISIRVKNSHYPQSPSVTFCKSKHFLCYIFQTDFLWPKFLVFFFKSDCCLECDSAYWWSRQHSGMQVSGWGLNMELTKDDCILNQMETVWGEKNEDILWTRPDPESVSRASALSTKFWQWNNAQIKGKIKVWERERIKQHEDDEEETDRNSQRGSSSFQSESAMS